MSNVFNQFKTRSNADKGAEIHIKCADGSLAYADDDDKKLKPIKIKVLGGDSSVNMELAAKELHDREKVKRESDKKSKGELLSVEEIQEAMLKTIDSEVEYLVKMVVAWENIEIDGKKLDCTPDNVRLCMGTYDEIRSQTILFIKNKVNFIKS